MHNYNASIYYLQLKFHGWSLSMHFIPQVKKFGVIYDPLGNSFPMEFDSLIGLKYRVMTWLPVDDLTSPDLLASLPKIPCIQHNMIVPTC